MPQATSPKAKLSVGSIKSSFKSKLVAVQCQRGKINSRRREKRLELDDFDQALYAKVLQYIAIGCTDIAG